MNEWMRIFLVNVLTNNKLTNNNLEIGASNIKFRLVKIISCVSQSDAYHQTIITYINQLIALWSERGHHYHDYCNIVAIIVIATFRCLHSLALKYLSAYIKPVSVLPSRASL